MNLQHPDISHDNALSKADCITVIVGANIYYDKSATLQVYIQLSYCTISIVKCQILFHPLFNDYVI